jgi:hypothetical protein
MKKVNSGSSKLTGIMFLCICFFVTSFILAGCESCNSTSQSTQAPAQDTSAAGSAKMAPMQDTSKAAIVDTGKGVTGGTDKPPKP